MCAESCTVDRKLLCGQEVVLWTGSLTVDRKFNCAQEVSLLAGSCTVDRKLYCGQEVALYAVLCSSPFLLLITALSWSTHQQIMGA